MLKFYALFNLRFDPKGVEGEKGLQRIEGVIKTYFNNGGNHIQINVVDDETLKAAQKDPEHYKGLMVRVAGYMAYFTELDKSTFAFSESFTSQSPFPKPEVSKQTGIPRSAAPSTKAFTNSGRVP